eukprot:gene11832-8430_t
MSSIRPKTLILYKS